MDENPQNMPPPQYSDGSRVLCADGQTLGEVVATYREYLIVERGYFFPTNFYVPYAAIAEAGGGDIVLALTGQDALAQGWHTPPEDPVVPETAAKPEPTIATPDQAAAVSRRQASSTPPPTEPAIATAAPIVQAEAEPPDVAAADDASVAAQEAAPEEATTAAPTMAAASEPEALTETPATAPAGQVSAAKQVPQEQAGTQEDAITTAAPAVSVEETVAVEEAVEVQSFQPDASVPPPAEPDEAGTVSLAPSFVGIPGRRLTDAELWSLLEPKEGPADTEGQPEDADDKKDLPEKPRS